MFMPVPSKRAAITTSSLRNRVFTVLSSPQTPHGNQGTEVENQPVKELQSVFRFSKTATSAYCPQGNSLLERVHSTMHDMLIISSNVKSDHWAELLPFMQPAHNTAYNQTLRRLPHYLMFGRRVLLQTWTQYLVFHRQVPHRLVWNTLIVLVDNLRFAYHTKSFAVLSKSGPTNQLSQRDATNAQFKPSDQVLVHRPTLSVLKYRRP